MDSFKAFMEAFRYCNTKVDLDKVHPFIRFLILARICVVFMTIYAVSIGGLLAWIEGSFNPFIFGLILLAFVLLHLADNLLNDYSDSIRGLDSHGYERLLYAPHPIFSGLLDVSLLKKFVASILIFSFILGLYLTLTVSPLIVILAMLGTFIMLGYSGYIVDIKRLGLGELGVFIVWGPVMAGGTYLALTGSYTLDAFMVYSPYGLIVSLVLIGKHLDKFDSDFIRKVYTLPIRIGRRNARILGFVITSISPLLLSIGLYLYSGTLYSLVSLASYISLIPTLKAFLGEKPSIKPEGWSIWPLWYAAWSYLALDGIGRYTVITLFLIGFYIYDLNLLEMTTWIIYFIMVMGDTRKIISYLKYFA